MKFERWFKSCKQEFPLIKYDESIFSPEEGIDCYTSVIYRSDNPYSEDIKNDFLLAVNDLRK